MNILTAKDYRAIPNQKHVSSWPIFVTLTLTLDSDDGKCKGENLGYKFDLFVRPNGTKVIKCRDKAGSCKVRLPKL